jgi:TonB-dependent starch-binding outer membrane protein SusC
MMDCTVIFTTFTIPFLPLRFNFNNILIIFPMLKHSISTSFVCLMVFLYMPALQAQQHVVKGRVVANTTNEPLAGVSVTVKGSTTGSSTAANGVFELTVPDSANTLIASYVGYETQETSLTPGFITISLKMAARALNEVVVVGYGTQQRRDVTAAVATVKPQDFNQGGARNVIDLIQGKVAGLSVTRTSASNPNSGVSIQLRSATSLTGSNSPLIVVDGIPGGNLDLLQQDDIESFNILKDGSAAAIYGTQANGGVIIVTTKKGKAGPPRFDYSTYWRKEFVRNKPDFMTPEQYRARAASGQYPSLTDAYTTGIYSANTNMYDSLINDNNLSNYQNLSMSGGTANLAYRASIYYSVLDGIAAANTRTQYGARFSLTQKSTDGRINSQIDLVTNYNKANLQGGGQFESALQRIPTLPVYDSSGKFYSVRNTPNPISDNAQTLNRRDQATNAVNASIGIEFFKGFKGNVFGSVMRDSQNDDFYENILSDASRYNDQYPNGGHAYKGTTLNTDYAFTPTLEYAKSINSKHRINAVAGYNYQYHVNVSYSIDNRGFFNDVNQNNNIGSGQAIADGKSSQASHKEDEKLIAFFGRINYSFLDRYLVQVSFRREGSTKFGANHKWGNFPAVSIGWDMMRESFMERIGWIDQLKLRAGYGVTGNSGIGPYQSLVRLNTGGQYGYPDGVFRQTYGPNNNANPDLRWEKKAETNVGIDFSLFKNRISGALDLFYRKTNDLLYSYNTQLPPFVQPSLYTNVGSLSSKGIELTLSGTVINQKNFSWRMDVAASSTKNKMLSLSNGTFKLSYFGVGGISGPGALGNALRITEGGAIGNFYGKKFAGLDDDGKWLFYKADGKTAVPLTDITESDQQILGNAIPKFYLSWTNSFVYKQFDLRVFFRGRFGNKILNTLDLDYGNRFALPNNVLNAAFDRYAQLNDTYQYSDYYLQPGGFFKLDNVTLGYTFQLPGQAIKNLRLYVAGNNLAIITRYKGNDPDYVRDVGLDPGIDGQGAYPSTRQLLVGLNLGF